MELTNDISGEQLPDSRKSSIVSLVTGEDGKDSTGLNHIGLSDEQIVEKVETILLDRINDGDKNALFQLGQLHFEQKEYEKAKPYFEQAAEQGDYQAIFQLGVILYDGLGVEPQYETAVEYMLKVAKSRSRKARHLLFAAQYNIGRGYFQGYGVPHKDDEAERWWLLAADDGNPKASVKAQCMLGMFYSRQDSRNLAKAFFWHSEACGNGSLESQGAIGVMYLHGVGRKKDLDAAFICLREAADRGNVYAMGNLAAYYYQRKLFIKAVEMAGRVSIFDEIEQIAEETDCIAGYIAKGIAIACFYYARCLHLGHGVKMDEGEAQNLYARSYQLDPDVCARLQYTTVHGEI